MASLARLGQATLVAVVVALLVAGFSVLKQTAGKEGVVEEEEVLLWLENLAEYLA